MEIVVGVLSSFAASVVFLALSRLVTPKISISPMISAYPSDNADADDTYRIKIIVEIYARDSWTGVGKLFRKTYALGLDSFKRGSFEFGNSLTIREYNGTAPFKLKDAYAARSTVGASPTA